MSVLAILRNDDIYMRRRHHSLLITNYSLLIIYMRRRHHTFHFSPFSFHLNIKETTQGMTLGGSFIRWSICAPYTKAIT